MFLPLVSSGSRDDWFDASGRQSLPPGSGAGRIALWLFLAALAMFFGAAAVLVVYLRVNSNRWLPAGIDVRPQFLWQVTALLALSSGTLHGALIAVRRRPSAWTPCLLSATLVLGLLFVAVQSANGSRLMYGLWSNGHALGSSTLLGMFFVLSLIHAAHIVGGLVPIAIVTSRAWRNRYSPAHHAGISFCGLYWHFLGGVWVLFLLTLF